MTDRICPNPECRRPAQPEDLFCRSCGGKIPAPPESFVLSPSEELFNPRGLLVDLEVGRNIEIGCLDVWRCRVSTTSDQPLTDFEMTIKSSIFESLESFHSHTINPERPAEQNLEVMIGQRPVMRAKMVITACFFRGKEPVCIRGEVVVDVRITRDTDTPSVELNIHADKYAIVDLPKHLLPRQQSTGRSGKANGWPLSAMRRGRGSSESVPAAGWSNPAPTVSAECTSLPNPVISAIR